MNGNNKIDFFSKSNDFGRHEWEECEWGKIKGERHLGNEMGCLEVRQNLHQQVFTKRNSVIFLNNSSRPLGKRGFIRNRASCKPGRDVPGKEGTKETKETFHFIILTSVRHRANGQPNRINSLIMEPVFLSIQSIRRSWLFSRSSNEVLLFEVFL